MKNMITWDRPCRLLHYHGGEHYTRTIKRRTLADWKRLVKATPKGIKIIRLDVHESEFEAFAEAADGFRLGRAWNLHRDALRREAGFGRCLLYTVDAIRTKTPTARDYYDVEELVKIAEVTSYDHEWLWPDADKKRRDTAARKAAVSEGKHKQKTPNANGQTVDVCKDRYIELRNGKTYKTKNAAATKCAREYGFTPAQVAAAATRGKWYAEP